MAAVVVGFGVLNMAVTAGPADMRRSRIPRRNLRGRREGGMPCFLENARAARAIKLFGKESVRTSVWRNKFVELMNVTLAGGRLTMFSIQSSQLTGTMSNVALISTGAYLVISNSITLGTMMMFVLFRTFFVETSSTIVRTTSWSCAAFSPMAERIDEVMSA